VVVLEVIGGGDGFFQCLLGIQWSSSQHLVLTRRLSGSNSAGIGVQVSGGDSHDSPAGELTSVLASPTWRPRHW
jgi:hypothetical protein